MTLIRKTGVLVVISMAAFFLFSVSASVYSADGEKNDEQTDGRRILGIERAVPKEKLSKLCKRIVIKNISFDGAAIQEVDETKHPDFKDVVMRLGTNVPDSVASHLKVWGLFERVLREGADVSGDERTLLLDARFTKITTGSRALRFWVGLGAGSSTVGIAGKLIDKDTGEVIADFENNSHSPASLSTYQAVLPADGAQNAKKIALFIKRHY